MSEGAEGSLQRFLRPIERLGNRLPDPAVLFVLMLLAVWTLSFALAGTDFGLDDPRAHARLKIVSLVSSDELRRFLTELPAIFTSFPPLGVVLVAVMGVGVAEHSGMVDALLRGLLAFTPRSLLSPVVILVSLISHVAADAGFVVVVPLAGVLFRAAGRHPLAGIAAAFAGVSCAFSASFLPAPLDPLLQGFTQSAAQLVEPGRQVGPLCNWIFFSASSVLLALIGWWLTDRIIEPSLQRLVVDGEPLESSDEEGIGAAARRGLGWAVLAGGGLIAGGLLLSLPEGAPFHTRPGESSPLLRGVVPLIFLGALVPGLAFGFASGRFRSHKDVIAGMAKPISTMGYYVVLAFFSALFIDAFTRSNLGVLLALEGARVLQAAGLPHWLTLVSLVLATSALDLVVVSASAKWALLSPVVVPMLLAVGLGPELSQAAYRVGDSVTNVLTPLNPYFPLIIVFCQRHVRASGLGTILSLMVPYAATFLVAWIALLLFFFELGIPLGV